MLEFEWAYYYDTLKLNVKPKGEYTPLRTVKEYEIELYTEDGGVSILNGEEFDIRKGNVIIATPGDKRQSKLHFKCHSVKFQCGDDFEFAKILQNISGVHHIKLDCDIVKDFENIRKVSGTPDNKMFLDACIRGLAAKLYKLLRDNSPSLWQHGYAMDKAIKFVSENADKKINLADIARSASISPSHFHRLFKQLYNMSPREYLELKRIELSKNLLLNNLLTVDEVAEKSGFFSRAYFDTVFKRKTGVTPVQFRKKHNTYL